MKKPSLIAIACGIGAMLFAALYLNSLEANYRKGSQKIEVLIAKQYIEQGTMIDTAMVQTSNVPRDYLQPKTLRSCKELYSTEGKKIFMTLVPIEPGEQITTTKLSILGLETGISSIVPADHRAVTLMCDRATVAGIVKPGNRIDIIGIFEYEDGERSPQEGAFTILQNILVLSAGKSLFGAAPANNAVQKENTSYELSDDKIAVSLSVTPHEAEMLVLAAERGTVRFTLRPTGDDRICDGHGTRIREIVKDIVSTKRLSAQNMGGGPPEQQQEMKRKQREVLELLNKYRH